MKTNKQLIGKLVVGCVLACCLVSKSQAQLIPPGGGEGDTNGYSFTNLYVPPPYVPGLKVSAQSFDGTNLHIGLLEADPAGTYDLFYASNLTGATWSDIGVGTNGQTNFLLTLPTDDMGFFRAARTDPAVDDAESLSFYFLNGSSNTNIVQAVVQGGPAAATSILVDSTNFANAVWIPFTSTPLVDIGTNEGTHEVWFGFMGTNGIAHWTMDTIIVDTTLPSIVITSPASNTTIKPIIQVQGYSTEPLASIYFDVTNTAGIFTNEQGFVTSQVLNTNTFATTTNFFQCFDIPLTNGDNTIIIHATDMAGNVTTTNVNITLDFSGDTNAPVVQITWPQDGDSIGGNTFTLRGVLDDETAQVLAQTVDTNGVTNNVEGIVERNGKFWLEDLPLNPGTNDVTITVADAAGNSIVTNLILIQSDVTITINDVADDQLNLSTTTVSGNVTDANYSVSVNGVQATVDANGNWTAENVPVLGEGTACFDIVAAANGGSSPPIKLTSTRERPPFVYVYQYSDQWLDVETNFTQTLGAAKNYAANVNSNGQLSYYGTGYFYYHVGEGYGWWDSFYQWSDTNQLGSFTTYGYDANGDAVDVNGIGNGDDFGLDFFSAPTQSWLDNLREKLVNYYARISYSWNWPAYGQSQNFSRTSITYMKLVTGGKNGVNRKNLFRIHGTATEYGQPSSGLSCAGPEGDVWPDTRTAINPILIRIMGKNLGSDGNLFTALPDNTSFDLIASAPGRHYGLFVSATKHRLFILANNSILSDSHVIRSAQHAIGEKMNFSPLFVPDLEEQPQETVNWTFGGQFINAFKVWLSNGDAYQPYNNKEDYYDAAYGLTDFRVDSDRLHLTNTFAWWQTGSTNGFESEKINLGLNLIFPNGQQVVVTASGQIGIHQPSVSWVASGYRAGVVAGKKLTGYGATGLYEVGLLEDGDGSGIYETAESQSLVPGQFGITQLVKRNASDPLNSWSDWRLDRSMPYDVGDHDAFATYDTLGHAIASLGDGPHMDWIGGVWSQDQFKDYFMYRANTTGSIWATLGTVDWNWFGSIVWCTGCTNGWVWTEDPQFYCSQSIAPSHQHPEFEATH